MPLQQQPPTKAEVKRLILALLAEETGDDYTELEQQIAVDVNCDTRVDSLSMVNVVLDLEQELGIVIEDGEFTPERLRSLDVFAEFLVEKASEASRAESRPA